MRKSCFIRWIGKVLLALPVRNARPHRRTFRPRLEQFEDRLVPTTITYTVTDPSDTAGSSTDVTLPYAITKAENTPLTTSVIDFNLPANTTITLTSYSNSGDGPSAFAIAGETKITIDGAGAPGLVISGDNSLRFFRVLNGSKLTIEHLTLEDGLAKGVGVDAKGGAIYNSGSVTVSSATVSSNRAQGKTGDSGHSGTTGSAGGNGGAA